MASVSASSCASIMSSSTSATSSSTSDNTLLSSNPSIELPSWISKSISNVGGSYISSKSIQWDLGYHKTTLDDKFNDNYEKVEIDFIFGDEMQHGAYKLYLNMVRSNQHNEYFYSHKNYTYSQVFQFLQMFLEIYAEIT